MTTRQQLSAAARPKVVVRRLTALLTLIAAIALPPAALLAVVGSPLTPPTQLRGTGALTASLDDGTVLWLLAAAGWLLWLHLLLTLAVELARQTRGSTLLVPLPGLLFGANTALATHLIAGLLLTGQPAPASGLTPAVARVPVSTTQPYLAAYRAPLAEVTGVLDVAAPAGADKVAPSPPGGPDRAAGLECRVLPPQGRDHDTLWDVAERHLGDGTRWRDIYALNHGRLMPDGQRLTRASLIRPGWTLRLPADAVALDVDKVSVTAPEPSGAAPATDPELPTPPAAHHHHAEPTPRLGAPTPGSLNEHPARQRGQQDPQGPPHRPAPEGPARTAAGPSAAPPLAAGGRQGQSTDGDGGAHQSAAVAAGLLGLASIGLIRSLTRRRRIASRRRPPGVRTAQPAESARGLEAQLRKQARVAEQTAATVQLALLLAGRDAPGTRLRALWQHPDGSYELDLAYPESPPPALPPRPFTASDRGWLLTADNVRFLYALTPDPLTPDPLTPEDVSDQERRALLAAERDRGPDPYPLLTPVGSKEGSVCLVNLELFGLISIVNDTPATVTTAATSAAETSVPPAGEPGREQPAIEASSLITGVVQALASAPWADLVCTYVPVALTPITTGFERLTPLDPSSEEARYALAELNPDEQQTVEQFPSLEQARHAESSLDLVGLSLWAGYTADQLSASLLRAAADPRNPNCALLIGPHPDAHTWTLDSSGQLHIPGVADGLTPVALRPDQQALTLRLLEHAEDPPHAAPDAPERATLIADCPPLDTPIPAGAPQGRAAPAVPPSGSAASPGDEHRLLRIDLTGYDTDAPGATGPGYTAPDVTAPDVTASDGAAPVHQQSLAQAEQRADVTSADAHVQEATPATPGPAPAPPPATPGSAELPQHLEVNVLGPLQIVGGQGDPPRRQCLELLVYLTLHRRPVPVKSLWEAVFPDRPYDSHQLVNRVSELRGFARQKLPQIKRTYQIDEFTISDWQHFQALSDGNPAQQLEALALVRGRPFEDLRLDWVHLEGQLAEIEASIVDLALAVGERALRGRDPDTARTAALAGLRGCPWEERLYRIAMQAAAALGATHEVHQLRRQLQFVLDDELDSDEDIQPATQQLYSALRDDEERRRRVAERRRTGA